MLAVLALVCAAGRATAEEPAATARPNELGFSAAGLQQITDTYQGYVDSGSLPGAVLLIARGDRVVYFEAIGYRNRETRLAMTRDAIFRIASMTKPIVSVAAMMLIEEGKLDLDSPVARYLPDFADPTVRVAQIDGEVGRVATSSAPAYRPISVRDLLRHTSGLDFGPFANAIVARAYRDPEAAEHEQSLAELVDGLARVPLRHQPGEVWEYSISVEVVGRLVEVASGMPLDRFIAERITGPLRMAATDFYVHPADLSRLAEFEKDRAGKQPPVADATRRPGWLSGGGGLMSSASDYLRFCEMLLDKGTYRGARLLSRGAVRLMTENALPPTVEYAGGPADLEDLAPTPEMDQGFGLGLAVRVTASHNPLPGAVGTFQWAGAFGTSFWVDPRENLIGVQMLQVPTPQSGVFRRTFRTLAYGALLPVNHAVAGR